MSEVCSCGQIRTSELSVPVACLVWEHSDTCALSASLCPPQLGDHPESLFGDVAQGVTRLLNTASCTLNIPEPRPQLNPQLIFSPGTLAVSLDTVKFWAAYPPPSHECLKDVDLNPQVQKTPTLTPRTRKSLGHPSRGARMVGCTPVLLLCLLGDLAYVVL